MQDYKTNRGEDIMCIMENYNNEKYKPNAYDYAYSERKILKSLFVDAHKKP